MTAVPWVMDLNESQFQEQVVQYAVLRGWKHLHIQRAVNERGRWRTPVEGMLGAGWPDLVLARGNRLVFAELKAEKGKVTGLQSEVLETLGVIPCAEVYVWRPSQLAEVMEILS